MAHAEQWSRDHACLEVALDVFATNHRARVVYEQCGYQPDHIRMVKTLGMCWHGYNASRASRADQPGPPEEDKDDGDGARTGDRS